MSDNAVLPVAPGAFVLPTEINCYIEKESYSEEEILVKFNTQTGAITEYPRQKVKLAELVTRQVSIRTTESRSGLLGLAFSVQKGFLRVLPDGTTYYIVLVKEGE